MLKSPSLRSTLVQKLYWRLLVLDEGHVLKNVATKLYQRLFSLRCEHCDAMC